MPLFAIVTNSDVLCLNLQLRETMKLQELIEEFQASGRYCFTVPEALKRAGSTKPAFQRALRRLELKQHILGLRKGFYVIIPVEYRKSGIIGPQLFIDPLMKHLGLPYYVGLLSACDIYGASHQKPMVFQVMTIRNERVIQKKGLKIKFYKKNRLSTFGYHKQQTMAGEFNLLTPEKSILDFIAYPFFSSGLDNITTILSDLIAKLDEKKFIKTIKEDSTIPLAHLQRIGYLLDLVDKSSITEELYKFIQKQHPQITPLRPDRNWRGAPHNNRWNVAVNAEVQPE